MKKLLHERLREYAKTDDAECIDSVVADFGIGDGICDIFRSIADEIERYYIPRPRFEDGEPVQSGDDFVVDLYHGKEVIADANYMVAALDGSCAYLLSDYDGYMEDDSYRFKRPTPKVYDADGVAYERGQHVWNIETGEEYIVIDLPTPDCYQSIQVESVESGYKTGYDPNRLTHEHPVYDADGVRIRKGDEGWSDLSGKKLAPVVGFTEDKFGMKVELEDGSWIEPINFIHSEPDSLSKIQQFASEWSHPDNVSNSSAGDFRDAMQEVSDRLTALIERGA